MFATGPSSEKSPQFRSPNVVAPTDGDPIPQIIAKTVQPSASGIASSAGAQPVTNSSNVSPRSSYNGPFPFASMTHAAQAIQSREAGVKASVQFKHHQPPPPPYPIAQEILTATHAATATATATSSQAALSAPQSVCILLLYFISIFPFLPC